MVIEAGCVSAISCGVRGVSLLTDIWPRCSCNAVSLFSARYKAGKGFISGCISFPRLNLPPMLVSLPSVDNGCKLYLYFIARW